MGGGERARSMPAPLTLLEARLPSGSLPRERAEGRRDPYRPPVAGGPVDTVHPGGARRTREHERGAPGQHRHLVAREPVAGVGTHAPAPEPHRPVGGERERGHHRAVMLRAT